MATYNLISWNVNGIRAVAQKGFFEFVKEYNPDIICLQETKAHPDQVEHKMDELGYVHEFWNSAQKKGYSGTAIFSKHKPLHVTYGLGIEKHDNEGRVITAEYENFFLVTVYTPNSKRELERLSYRYHEWDVDFLAHCKKLEEIKPVIFCGDLNVAHTEIDIARPDSNKTTSKFPGSAGFTDQERERFSQILDAGFIDTWRFLNPDATDKYTWWSYMFNARRNNVGWRIDYFCASQVLKDNIKDAEILDHVTGSDHCPVSLTVKF